MKRITAIALVALAGLLTAGSLSAQDDQVQAKIPFGFRVGNSPLPAGTYTISKSMSGVITVSNHDWPSLTVFSVTNSTDVGTGAAKLIFNKYGEQYFLSRIQCPYGMNVELPASKLERRAKIQEARMGGPQRVLLALR